MVIRTIKKEKDNLPYQRQNLSWGSFAEGSDRKMGGTIKSERRDDNGKKIDYQVKLFGEVAKPLRVSSLIAL